MGERLHQHHDLFVEVQAGGGRMQAEEILPLAHPDDHRDAGRETNDDRAGNEADYAAEPRDPEYQQDDTGHERGSLQAGDAVLRGDAGQHRDERAGGSRDLHARPAQQAGGEASNNGGVQPLCRGGARGDRKGHRQRHGDDADDHAGDDVREQVRARQQAGATGFEEGDHPLAFCNRGRWIRIRKGPYGRT